ncbi:MAG: S8 family serine peptidase, partial [Monoglobus pectinilyticus]
DADLNKAWSVSKGEGAVVAVIDTGVDVNHPELFEKIVDGWDFYNNRSEVYNEDLGFDQAHGTHVAGIIAKAAPEAKIMPLKVFENGKAYTSDIIKAIEYEKIMEQL